MHFRHRRGAARISNRLRRLGTIHHADFRRNDDAYLRSNPETVRQIDEAIQRVRAGQGRVVTLDEIRGMLGFPPE